jgi:hypothetical protein
MATLSNNLGARLSKNTKHKYECVCCDYKCSKKFNYDRHILSHKHIKTTQSNILEIFTSGKWKNPVVLPYSCLNCGKEYKDRTGLWRHKKVCSNETIIESSHISELNKDELIITLLKQNADLIKGQHEMFAKLTENGINNYSNNTTNSHK